MIGRTISHYRILEKLGEGGMGVVYLAEDTVLGRRVAIKTLTPRGGDNKHFRTRFLREATTWVEERARPSSPLVTVWCRSRPSDERPMER